LKQILLIILTATFISGCKKESLKWYDVCPEEVLYNQLHYLQIPFVVSPQQLNYEVGDTLFIESNFSDSIYDLNRDMYYEIQDFPFRPVAAFYKVNDNSWESGFNINELLIEDKYNPRYGNTPVQGSFFEADMTYENSSYQFDYQIILNNTGRYCTLITDRYNGNGNSGDAGNAIANAIEFEGKCPVKFEICNSLEGDTNHGEFLTELQFLDTAVWGGNLYSNAYPEYLDGGTRSRTIEWNGVFCFEVLE